MATLVQDNDIPAPVEKPTVTFSFEGQKIEAAGQLTVAEALLSAGQVVLSRGPKYHRPRGLFCARGHCGSCLMRIDGEPNVRACVTPLKADMRVERQNSFPSPALDVLPVADTVFECGFDHHHFFTRIGWVNRAMQKTLRPFSGIGRLPDHVTTAVEPRLRELDVLVVGSGPAGRAAAETLAGLGREVLLVDEQLELGGSELSEAGGRASVRASVDRLDRAAVEMMAEMVVIGWYPEDAPVEGTPGIIAALSSRDRQLCLWQAEHIVYATGSYEQNLLFAENDRPGVIAARAVGRMAEAGLVAGGPWLIYGDSGYAASLGAIAATRNIPHSYVGEGALTSCTGQMPHLNAEVRDPKRHASQSFPCGVIAVAATPAPATELPRLHGVAVDFAPAKGGFYCVADEHGQTAVPGVWVCGDVTGYMGVTRAEMAGRRVARAIGAKK